MEQLAVKLSRLYLSALEAGRDVVRDARLRLSGVVTVFAKEAVPSFALDALVQAILEESFARADSPGMVPEGIFSFCNTASRVISALSTDWKASTYFSAIVVQLVQAAAWCEIG